jgi:hypothetical protein
MAKRNGQIRSFPLRNLVIRAIRELLTVRIAGLHPLLR